jgi:hypothetical protein
MARLTRKKDQYPCRIADGCPADDWIMELGGNPTDSCKNCPFEKYINALANYEDEEERIKDDGK